MADVKNLNSSSRAALCMVPGRLGQLLLGGRVRWCVTLQQGLVGWDL